MVGRSCPRPYVERFGRLTEQSSGVSRALHLRAKGVHGDASRIEVHQHPLSRRVHLYGQHTLALLEGAGDNPGTVGARSVGETKSDPTQGRALL